MKINVKLTHRDAVLPVFKTPGAAGADVCACLPDGPVFIHPGQTRMIPLGFAMALPDMDASAIKLGAFLLPRSGLGSKDGIVLGNLVGLIDQDYRGEVTAAVWNRNGDGQAFRINHGDRIAQMVIQPVIQAEFTVVDNLDATERGTGGFGSTGLRDMTEADFQAAHG